MASDKTSGNFHAVQVKFQKGNRTVHYLFFKKHYSEEDDKERPNDRTLVIDNVPPYCNKHCLHRLFGNDDNVKIIVREDISPSTARSSDDSMDVQNSNQVYSVAYVVYKSSEDLQNKLQELKRTATLSTDDINYHSGIEKWCSAYSLNRPNPVRLQNNVDKYIRAYDEEQKREMELSSQTEGVPDEDGWITVTRKTKKRVVQRTEQKQQWLKAKEAKKKKQQEQLTFYAFQIRQSKRDHIAELRRKFAEDKERIACMKAARKFKPY